MEDITQTYSSRFYNVERRIHQLIIGRYSDWASRVAAGKTKEFSKLQEAYVFEILTKGTLIDWLMQLEPTPMELSEIIEEIEANKTLTLDIKKRKIIEEMYRPTGE